ncbi:MULTISPECIES: dihydrodipicolinate synthase family protein [Nocardia]|uniref:dihydrodipicolinate synthase family protein n=1 Tax=Nocardia abscessus TaxID=120957 RepID=UPI001E331B58|nr:dihydrodipicolinate synthase family protein [Nocardia abscessus]
MGDTMAHNAISGIVARMVTPFAADFGVDADMMRMLVNRMINAGVDAIMPLGDSGESEYLGRTEWRQATAICLEHINGRVPCIVDVSDVTTAGAVERARFAERLNATAIMVKPVSCWRLSANELRLHFATIAEFVGLPMMIGNDPAATGADMPPEFLADLAADIPTVTMVEESSGLIGRIGRIGELSGGAVSVFNGSDLHVLHAATAGAAGWTTAAVGLLPEQIVRVWQLMNAGHVLAAAELFDDLAPLLAAIDEKGAPATIKSGLRVFGLDAGDPRLPQLPLDRDTSIELAELIGNAQTSPPRPPHDHAMTHHARHRFGIRACECSTGGFCNDGPVLDGHD